jgi:RNA polymerase sigma-70 factor (ECF subfamily)
MAGERRSVSPQDGRRRDYRVTALTPSLRRYARGLVGSREDADGLVAATLQRAAQLMHYYGDDRESRVRLFALMHQVYLDQNGRGAHAVQSAGVHHFDRLIAALPPPQREVFLLVTLEGLSYEEAAKALDVPIGTVMSRLSRAREKLRARLRA